MDFSQVLGQAMLGGQFNPRKVRAGQIEEQRKKTLAEQLEALMLQEKQQAVGPQVKTMTAPNGQLIAVTTQGGNVISSAPLGQKQATAGQPGGSMMLPGQYNTSQQSWNQPQLSPKPEPKRSASYLKAVDEGLTPGTPNFVKRVQELNNPRSAVNVNVGQDSDPLGVFTETTLGSLNERATTAGQREYDASVGLDLLRSRIQAGNETGKWAPIQTEVAAYLGTDPDGVATAQLFDVKMGDKVMQRIQQTKGAVSEKEMAYFGKISPGSDKEPFTNYALLEIDRRAAVREQDKLNYVEDYLQEKGNLLGFDKWYMKNHDPFKNEFSVDSLRKQYDEWASSPNTSGQSQGWSVERID